MYRKLNEKIRNKLTEYLEFDVDLLFKNDVDLAYIFGGAIRDIIANVEINDIDIMCCAQSYKKLCDNLIQQNYILDCKYTSKDIMNLYSNIRVIYEPTNFIKISNGKIKTIQLIRPGHNMNGIVVNGDYKSTIKIAITEVDINICGVYYNPIFGLKESVEDAIFFIKNKAFTVNKKAAMFQNNRIYSRVDKLEKKGYLCLDKDYINYTSNPFVDERTKIDNIKDGLYKKLIRYKKLIKII